LHCTNTNFCVVATNIASSALSQKKYSRPQSTSPLTNVPSISGLAVPSYHGYGVTIRSSWPLPLPLAADIVLPAVELMETGEGDFAAAYREMPDLPRKKHAVNHFKLSDESDYLGWTGMFEFLVSADGLSILGRVLPGGTPERLTTYLLGPVMSFALVKLGMEPLHATAVVNDGRAIAFIGNSGYGKSTLASGCLRAGFTLLTDDLLAIARDERGLIGYPGPARIKLFPNIAEQTFVSNFSAETMNQGTSKQVLPLSPSQGTRVPVPLDCIYMLNCPEEPAQGAISIRPLTFDQACVALVANTFNTIIQSRKRQAQQFRATTEWASNLSVCALDYPRDLSVLSEVVAAIMADMDSRVN
jgi:hypothetical protein